MQTIIVGIDGSAGASAALEFAAEEATLRSASLRAVAVWEVGPRPIGRAPALDEIEVYRGAADAAARAAQERLDAAWPGLPTTVEAWEGIPADVLVSLADEADLLVVGNRGHGEAATLVLGSVSQHVVQHARCPVIVIPHLWAASRNGEVLHHRSAP